MCGTHARGFGSNDLSPNTGWSIAAPPSGYLKKCRLLFKAPKRFKSSLHIYSLSRGRGPGRGQNDRPDFRRPPNPRSSEIPCQPQPYQRQPPQRIQRHRIYLRRTGQPHLPPAARRRKPILPIRFRKPTRPRRNQKSSGQHRNLDIRLRPVRPPPFQRTPRQTRLDEHQSEAHPLCLGRQPPVAGIHL